MIVANALRLPYADGSAHAAITSPPYYQKRRYSGVEPCEWPAVTYRPMPGLPEVFVPAVRWRPAKGLRLLPVDGDVPGQSWARNPPEATVWLDDTPDAGILGLEPDPLAYIGHLVLIFREAWRVLRDDGVLCVNIGDSYAHSKTGRGSNGWTDPGWNPGQSATAAGYKPKDLMGIPWRLAFALIADGWTLRSRMPGGVEGEAGVDLRPDVIWRKNAMPESVRDRPSVDFEDVFIFSKQKRYFWDQENGREGLADPNDRRPGAGGSYLAGSVYSEGDGKSGLQDTRGSLNQYSNQSGANMRASWKITTEPTKAEHYAAFPRELVRRLIRVATSDKGCCPECGAPWRREVKRTRTLDGEPVEIGTWQDDRDHSIGAQGAGHWRFGTRIQDLGWRPGCECIEVVTEEVWAKLADPSYLDSGRPFDPVPCSVLDPFSGIGRTGEVCYELGRRYLPVELSIFHANIQKHRLTDHVAVARDIEPSRPTKSITGPLFPI